MESIDDISLKLENLTIGNFYEFKIGNLDFIEIWVARYVGMNNDKIVTDETCYIGEKRNSYYYGASDFIRKDRIVSIKRNNVFIRKCFPKIKRIKIYEEF